MRLLIDASNVTASGPLVIARELLPRLVGLRPDDELTVLVAEGSPLVAALDGEKLDLRVLPRRGGLRNDVDRVVHTMVRVPRLARATRADVCLTFGDIGPVAPPCPHVLFVHQAHLVQPLRELDGVGRGWLKERYLAAHLGASARRAARIIVQTPVMAERLAARHGVEPSRIATIAQPPPPHVARRSDGVGAPPALAACPAPVTLLFLAAYYRHKNHRIVADVAADLRRRGLADRVRIFLTIADADWQRPELEPVRLATDVVVNLGPLGPDSVAPALSRATALFLPTLMESYGLPYVEALRCGTPVLTSDRDFARWACRDLAIYFDPLSAESIVDAIVRLMTHAEDRADFERRARARLSELPGDWNEVASAFSRLLDDAVMGKPR